MQTQTKTTQKNPKKKRNHEKCLLKLQMNKSKKKIH